MTERGILTGVAWADIIACAIVRYLPTFVIAFTLGVLIGVILCRGK